MTMGERIKTARINKGLTQQALGDLCGIAGPTIRKYESGRLNPKIETLQKIAAALDCPVSDLFTAGDILPTLAPVPVSVFAEWLSSIGYDVKVHDIEYEYGGGQSYHIREQETWDDCPVSLSELEMLRDSVTAFAKFQIAELFNAKKAGEV